MCDNLCELKKALISKAYAQVENLDNVSAQELGEVIDMIKDIELTIYYCTAVEAMENSTSENVIKHLEIES